MRVNILGAGVAGLCAATELTSRGVDVRIFDKAEGPGPDACSWWAGGMLAPECEGALAEPAVVHHGRSAADWWAGKGANVIRKGTPESKKLHFACERPYVQDMDGLRVVDSLKMEVFGSAKAVCASLDATGGLLEPFRTWSTQSDPCG